MKHFFFIILLTLIVSGTVFSQKTVKEEDWKFNFQAQIRGELDGRDFTNKTYAQTYANQRIRFGVEKTFFNSVNVFAQIQDSRLWGEEGTDASSTTTNIKNLDLHQGYVKLINPMDIPIWAQFGRFKMSYGDQKFIGVNDWGYTGRTFDGFRIGYKNENTFVDFFGATISPTLDKYRGTVTPSSAYPIDVDKSTGLYGIWSSFKLVPGHTLDLFGMYEIYRSHSENNVDPNIARFTLGFEYDLKVDNFFARADFGYQMGSYADLNSSNEAVTRDIGAYTGWITLGYKFTDLQVSLNGDIYSGMSIEDQAKEDSKATFYVGDYNTKHSLAGYMDYFTNIASNTNGMGLNDIFLRFLYEKADNPFSAQLDFHYFMTNQPWKIYDKDNPDGKENSSLGEEIDIVLKYNVIKGATLEWGGSVFLPGDVMKDWWLKNKGAANEIKREDMAFWSYLMLRVNLQ